MSKPATLRLGILALALAGLWTALTQNQQAPVELTLEKVADDLHVIMGGGGNVAVYDTPEGVILIDDKFDQHVEQILAKVKGVHQPAGALRAQHAPAWRPHRRQQEADGAECRDYHSPQRARQHGYGQYARTAAHHVQR